LYLAEKCIVFANYELQKEISKNKLGRFVEEKLRLEQYQLAKLLGRHVHLGHDLIK